MMAGVMIFERRPYYVVFAVERFEVVERTEVDQGSIRHDAHRHKPFTSPRYVYAELPTDPEAHSRLVDEVVFEGCQDIDRRPEFWRPYRNGISTVKAAANLLANLLQCGDKRKASVQKWLSRQSGGVDNFLYVPLRGHVRNAAMILHIDSDLPVDIIYVDSW